MDKLLSSININKMTIIVALPANSVEMASAAEKNGAHAIKTHIRMTHRASKVKFGTLEQERDALSDILNAVNLPVGIVPGASLDVTTNDLEEIVSMGFDFYDMFATFIRPEFYEIEGISVMGAVDSSFDFATIATLSRKPIQMMELAIVPGTGYGEALSVVDLAKYRQVIERMSIPAVIPSQRTLIPEDVPYLYETGAKALLIGVLSTGTDIDALSRQTAAFREAVEKL